MAAREERNAHCIEFLERLIPFIASKRTFREGARELATGVNMFSMDHWVEIDPVKQPFKCHSLGAG